MTPESPETEGLASKVPAALRLALNPRPGKEWEILHASPPVLTPTVPTSVINFSWVIAALTASLAIFIFLKAKSSRMPLVNRLVALASICIAVSSYVVASGHGYTVVSSASRSFAPADKQLVFYAPYVGRALACPLVVAALGMFAGLSTTTIAMIAGLLELSVLSFLAGSMKMFGFKWSYMIIGVIATLMSIYLVRSRAQKDIKMSTNAAFIRPLGYTAAAVTSILSLYPVVWGLCGGSSKSSVTTHPVLNGMLDLSMVTSCGYFVSKISSGLTGSMSRGLDKLSTKSGQLKSADSVAADETVKHGKRVSFADHEEPSGTAKSRGLGDVDASAEDELAAENPLANVPGGFPSEKPAGKSVHDFDGISGAAGRDAADRSIGGEMAEGDISDMPVSEKMAEKMAMGADGSMPFSSKSGGDEKLAMGADGSMPSSKAGSDMPGSMPSAPSKAGGEMPGSMPSGMPSSETPTSGGSKANAGRAAAGAAAAGVAGVGLAKSQSGQKDTPSKSSSTTSDMPDSASASPESRPTAADLKSPTLSPASGPDSDVSPESLDMLPGKRGSSGPVGASSGTMPSSAAKERSMQYSASGSSEDVARGPGSSKGANSSMPSKELGAMKSLKGSSAGPSAGSSPKTGTRDMPRDGPAGTSDKSGGFADSPAGMMATGVTAAGAVGATAAASMKNSKTPHQKSDSLPESMGTSSSAPGADPASSRSKPPGPVRNRSKSMLIDPQPAAEAVFDPSKLYDDSHFSRKDISASGTESGAMPKSGGRDMDMSAPAMAGGVAAGTGAGMPRSDSGMQQELPKPEMAGTGMAGKEHPDTASTMPSSGMSKTGLDTPTERSIKETPPAKPKRRTGIAAAILGAVGASGYQGVESVLNENEVITGTTNDGTALSKPADEARNPKDSSVKPLESDSSARGPRAKDIVDSSKVPGGEGMDPDVNVCSTVPEATGETGKGSLQRGTLQGATQKDTVRMDVDEPIPSLDTNVPAGGTDANMPMSGGKPDAGLEPKRKAPRPIPADVQVLDGHEPRSFSTGMPDSPTEPSYTMSGGGVSPGLNPRVAVRSTAGRYIDPNASLLENLLREPTTYGGPFATEVDPSKVSDKELGITPELVKYLKSGNPVYRSATADSGVTSSSGSGDSSSDGSSATKPTTVKQKILAPFGLVKRAKSRREAAARRRSKVDEDAAATSSLAPPPIPEQYGNSGGMYSASAHEPSYTYQQAPQQQEESDYSTPRSVRTPAIGDGFEDVSKMAQDPRLMQKKVTETVEQVASSMPQAVGGGAK
ncbi:hypothetical protein BZA70DRAFT_290600 [Myxozyma melibiosi]|uniref:Uncharacterized protein n=1 Tax=Myxozyma melibiosi TaxID=54550 RepID=A0ABR1F2L5_9ASCO